MNSFASFANQFAANWSSYFWHSSWQAALFAAIIFCIVAWFKRWPAPLRYSLLILVLIKFAIPPFQSSSIGIFAAFPSVNQLAANSNSGEATSQTPIKSPSKNLNDDDETANSNVRSSQQNLTEAVDPAAGIKKELDADLVNDLSSDGPTLQTINNESGTPISDAEFAATIERLQQTALGGQIASPQTNAGNLQAELASANFNAVNGVDQDDQASITPAAASSFPKLFFNLDVRAWMMLIHLLGSLILLAVLTKNHHRLRTILKNGKPISNDAIVSQYSAAANRLRIKRLPKLIESDEVTAPFALGCISPMIVLPSSLLKTNEDTPQHLSIAISHELAHHRRCDTWVNMLQNLLFVVFWFHPMLWLLNRMVRQTREECCDDLLINEQIINGESYSQTLLDIARLSPNDRFLHANFSGAIYMTHPLGQRIMRIMDPSQRRHSKLTVSGLVSVLLAGLLFLPGLRANETAMKAGSPEFSDENVAASPAIESPPELNNSNGGIVDPTQVAPQVTTDDREKFPVSGRVIDKKTGKGVPNVGVRIQLLTAGSIIKKWSDSLTTDKDGNYSTRCPAGRVSTTFSPPEDSKYARPSGYELFTFSSFEVLAKEKKTVIPDFELMDGIDVKGVVVDKNGDSAPRVDLFVYGDFMDQGSKLIKPNMKGEFIIENVHPFDMLSIVARSKRSASNGPNFFRHNPNVDRPVKITVSEDFAAYAKGSLVDSKKQKIQTFSVDVQEIQLRLYGIAQAGSVVPQKNLIKASSDGSFRTLALLPRNRYSLIIRSEGYSDFQTKSFVAEPGKTFDFGKIKLTRSNLTLNGVVRGTDGQPIEDVQVYGYRDGKSRVEATSNSNGAFSVKGWPEENMFLFAEKGGYQSHGQLIENTDQAVRIELRRLDEAPNVSPSEMPYTVGERMAFCKDLLEELYELPLEKRKSFNKRILRNMAWVDSEQARRWIASPENKDHRELVKSAIAESLLDTDPETAVAMFADNKYFSSTLRIFDSAFRVDLPMSIRRKLVAILPDRMDDSEPDIYNAMKFAKLANLYYQVGDLEAGKVHAAFAFSAAENFMNTEEGFEIGTIGKYLAVYDVARAKTLVANLKDRNGSKDFFLGNIANQIAATDPDGAIQIAERINSKYSSRIVHAIAKVDAEKALKVVDQLFERGEVVAGRFSLMAALMGGKDQLDKQKFESRLHQIFETYASRVFKSTDGYRLRVEGSSAGYAALTAKQLGLPNAPVFAMKALATFREKSLFVSNVTQLSASVEMAKYLSLVDRNAGRILLDKIEEQNEVIGRGGEFSVHNVDYFQAWALTDHKKAKQLFNEMLKDELERKTDSRLTWYIRVISMLSNPNDEALLRRLTQDDKIWRPLNGDEIGYD